MKTKKRFTYFMALKVAREDMGHGVVFAMEMLRDYGFEIPVYRWFSQEFGDAEMKYRDLDFDALNLSARDADYKNLGIYDLMQKAYEAIADEY